MLQIIVEVLLHSCFTMLHLQTVFSTLMQFLREQTLRERFLSEPEETRETLQRIFDVLTSSGYNLDQPARRKFVSLTDEEIEKFNLNLREKMVIRCILAGEATGQ